MKLPEIIENNHKNETKKNKNMKNNFVIGIYLNYY